MHSKLWVYKKFWGIGAQRWGILDIIDSEERGREEWNDINVCRGRGGGLTLFFCMKLLNTWNILRGYVKYL